MQPRIIEVIGAPGSGKSTIYDALCQRWRHSSNWIYPGALLYQNRADRTIRQSFEYFLRCALKKKLHAPITTNDGIRYIKCNDVFASYCLQLLSDPDYVQSNDIASKYRSIYFLYRDFCLRQAILDAAPDKPCLVDEGFLQKSFLVSRATQNIGQIIDKYIHLMTTPLAVIVVAVADIEVLLRRIRSRKKVIASHIGMTDSELRKDLEFWVATQSLIAKKAKETGIFVFEIDGQVSIRTNVNIINKVVSKNTFQTIDQKP